MESLIPTLSWENKTLFPYLRVQPDLKASVKVLLEDPYYAELDSGCPFVPFETKVVYFIRGYWHPAFLAEFKTNGRVCVHKALGKINVKSKKMITLKMAEVLLFRAPLKVPEPKAAPSEVPQPKAAPLKTPQPKRPRLKRVVPPSLPVADLLVATVGPPR